MATFKINEKCEGCGLCAAIHNNVGIKIEYDNQGYLRAVNSGADMTDYTCALNVEPTLNPVIERLVAYHKQIDRRMDGSAGGVFGALLETVTKKGYYFTGTIADENHRVHHVVTNDPEQIKAFAGYHPVQSDCSKVLPKIKALLESGEKVLFAGTSMQCHALQLYVGTHQNLIMVEIIATGFVSQLLYDKYIREKEKEYGSQITGVRLYNKEYSYLRSKRFTLVNGRTFFTKKSDSFDELTDAGRFTKRLTSRDNFKYLDKRIGDISIGLYVPEKDWSDKLGYTYVSINTPKGQKLLRKASKRLVVVKKDSEIIDSNIQKAYHSYRDLDYTVLETSSLSQIVTSLHHDGTIRRFINELKLWKHLFDHIKRVSQLRPSALYKFFKYNFFTKGIHTDYRKHGLIFVAPYSELSLDKGAEIDLHGPLEIGIKRVKSSKLETRLWMKPKSKILVHEKCMFGYGSNVEVYSGGLLEVGNLFSNAELTIICGKHIKLGNTVNIAKGCTVRDTNGHVVATPGFKQLRPVELGNHTWICSNTTIMPGVKVGDGAIVGSCSYVTKNVKPFTLVQGNPAIELSAPNYFRI